MTRCLLIIYFATASMAAQMRPICVESVLDKKNTVVGSAQANGYWIEQLPQALIDMLKTDLPYYQYYPYQSQVKDKPQAKTPDKCTRISFTFLKPAATAPWITEIKVSDPQKEIAPWFFSCQLFRGWTMSGSNQAFKLPIWEKVVSSDLSTCFSENLKKARSDSRFELSEVSQFDEIAIIGSNVQDRCKPGVETPGCLVLPIPYQDPFRRLATTIFSIAARKRNGQWISIRADGLSQCASYPIPDSGGKEAVISKFIVAKVVGLDLAETPGVDWKEASVRFARRGGPSGDQCPDWTPIENLRPHQIQPIAPSPAEQSTKSQ
jgi:hypothetical protein